MVRTLRQSVFIGSIGIFVVKLSVFAATVDNRPEAGKVVSVTGKVLDRFEVIGKPAGVQELKPGMVVHEGDVINTSSLGSVKILLADRTILDLGPSSLFNVKQFTKNAGDDRQVDMTMMYGTVRAAVSQKIQGKGSFKIRTSSVTMGVRGTEFVVKSEMGDLKQMSDSMKEPDKGSVKGKTLATANSTPPPKTEVIVLQGKVDVEPAKAPPTVKGRLLSSTAAVTNHVVSLTAGQKIESNGDQPLPQKPVQLDQKQIAEISTSAKVIDNTFSKAIVVDTTPKSENGGAGGSIGQATAAAIQASVASAVSPPTGAPGSSASGGSAGNSGFIGTFGTSSGLTPPPVFVTVGGMRKLHVVISR